MYLPRHLAIPFHRAAGAGESLVLAGPRGAGKTTFLRKEFPAHLYVSLDDRATRESARENPQAFLSRFRREAVIDEAHRVPGLLAQAGNSPFPLIFASALRISSPLRSFELYPPSRAELQRRSPLPLSVFGRFEAKEPSGLATQSWPWSRAYLDKDLPSLIRLADRDRFEQFLDHLAARSATVLNQLELAREMDLSHRSIVRWQEALDTCFQTLTIPASRDDYGRRLIRAPKLHALWAKDSFETQSVFELYRNARHAGLDVRLQYWRDSNGFEIPLLLEAEDFQRIPVAISESASPGMEAGLARWLALAGASHAVLITKRKSILHQRDSRIARYSASQL